MPKTQVYHPYGWTSTMSPKHTMRIVIVKA